MSIKEHLDGGKLTLFIVGNFDETTCEGIERKFGESFAKSGVSDICIDLGSVKYLSSAGIRVLIVAHKKGVKSNKKVTLGQMSEKAREVLDIVGIIPLFSGKTGRV